MSVGLTHSLGDAMVWRGVSPPKSKGWKPNTQGDGTKRWDLWAGINTVLWSKPIKIIPFPFPVTDFEVDRRYSLANDIQKEVCCWEEGLLGKAYLLTGASRRETGSLFSSGQAGSAHDGGSAGSHLVSSCWQCDIQNHPISGSRSLGMAKDFLTV